MTCVFLLPDITENPSEITGKGAFTVILIILLFRAAEPLDSVVRGFTPLLSFRYHPGLTFPCRPGCPVAGGYFCDEISHSSTAANTQPHCGVFNTSPKIGHGVCWGVSLLEGSKDSCAQLCLPRLRDTRGVKI